MLSSTLSVFHVLSDLIHLNGLDRHDLLYFVDRNDSLEFTRPAQGPTGTEGGSKGHMSRGPADEQAQADFCLLQRSPSRASTDWLPPSSLGEQRGARSRRKGWAEGRSGKDSAMNHSPGEALLSLLDTFPPFLTSSLISSLCAGGFFKSHVPGSTSILWLIVTFLLPNYLRSLP